MKRTMKEVLEMNEGHEFSIDNREYKVSGGSLYVNVGERFVHSAKVTLTENEIDNICAILIGNVL